MTERAEVIVVGGGVMGLSAAFHLAEAGVDVMLLERDELGSGSTCRAAGGVRAQFSDPVNIELARRSLTAYESFGRRPGAEIDLRQHGYLFLLDNDADVAAFEAGVRLQNQLGVPSRMLTVEQAVELSPLIVGDGLLAAAFSPTDGHCTPEAVVQGYARGARALGARIRQHCAVTGIEAADGVITGVRTTDGLVDTSTVVVTAGAWSAEVGAMAGVPLPVVPLRRQIIVTSELPDVRADLPMTIDFGTSFYFHPEGPGLLVGMSDPDQEPGFHLGTGDEWLPGLAEAVQRRAPALADVGIAHRWAGLYEMSPDHNALIGEARDVSRLLYATGFSGHGFLQGPAVGEVLRDLVLGVPPVVDVSGLSAGRFAARSARPELNCV
ncbi:FAD-binding oxidoreductase [Kutzneria buriramensis]|uniref:Sarcosine oxidase subunit beta n=1 Tax=Kutzneria buriramensis TaxID=1045776 RepID=A0A3E0HU58_9PSEU|nr:FAD-binding oxidoreductase [Kutzneria buriramensis]REH50082.1 sarcosine oxidase subunit beta [Kutzneria buriramensis]